MLKIASLFILLVSNVSKSTQNYKVYFQQIGKRLTATQINSVVNNQAMDCLNVCLFDVRCEAFNAYKGADGLDRCDFFDKDRCSHGASLAAATSGSYFDTRDDQPCPKRE